MRIRVRFGVTLMLGRLRILLRTDGLRACERFTELRRTVGRLRADGARRVAFRDLTCDDFALLTLPFFDFCADAGSVNANRQKTLSSITSVLEAILNIADLLTAF